MERYDREHRDEPQGQEAEVVRNVIEPDEGNVDRLHSQQRTRSRGSFPANDEGLDGDQCTVVVAGETWKCEKVRGAWFRHKMGKTTDVDEAEKSVVKVVNKSFGGGGIEEAPIDGKQYARQDADWAEVQTASTAPDVDIDDGDWDLGTDTDIDCGGWT